jgi:K+-transporting ATPase ATPase C chain
MKNVIIAMKVSALTLIVTGMLYPFAVTGVSKILFPDKAEGSLIKRGGGECIGSSLIGQSFSKPCYFQGRISAAGNGYDPLNSGGSNLGPSSQKLRDRIKADIERLQKENPAAHGPVPVELVTASASGLDPHISPEAALWQIPRIAAARNVPIERIRDIVTRLTEKRDLWVLGEQRVNVLKANLELDKTFGIVK